VVTGTHGYGTAARLLLGSVSHDTIHLMSPKIREALVKAGYQEATTRSSGDA
jgi:hypothetical protein